MRASETMPSPLEPTVLRAVLVYRVLALLWMAALVVSTLGTDEGANRAVVVGTLALATVWTIVTLFVAREREVLTSNRFLAADGLVALFVASSSIFAQSEDAFYGGFAASWLILVAYARPLPWAVAAAALLASTQLMSYLVGAEAVSSLTALVGSVVMSFVVATVFGWGFSRLRLSDQSRIEAQEALDEERHRRTLVEARAGLADRLHDSVLQTLNLIQKWAEDPKQVRYLARSEERQLRRMIREMTSPYESSSLAAALQSECDEVEDLYRVTIKRVISGDCRAEGNLEHLVQATREALVNAGKHAEVQRIHVHAQVADGLARVLVKDRGVGFDPSEAPAGHRGLSDSIVRRLESHGGQVKVRSEPGAGTEIELEMPYDVDLG